MSSTETLRAGIVGLGRWAAVLADAVGRGSALELVACYTRDPERRATFAQRYACRAADSFADLLADPAVEGVIVTTPNDTHADLVEQAALAGKHVYTEKPIANTLSDGTRIADACRRAGVRLAVGHGARYAGPVQKIRELLTQGAVGEVSLVEANFSNDRGLELTPDRWRWFRDNSPGGPLIQLAVHHLDTLQALFGLVTAVSAQVRRLYTRAEVDDVAVLICGFQSGPLAYIGSSWATAGVYSINVYGTRGAVFYTVDFTHWSAADTDAHSQLLFQPRDSADRQPVPFEAVDMYRAELDDWAAAIRADRQPTVSASEGLAALRLVWAALESSETGRTVRPDSGVNEDRGADVGPVPQPARVAQG
ncbi:MAG TPA: Gfo/Idh/MocA family oxidoreductase [Chloroflexota bacterium]|nr:Gfo/Idh/MocA family oxidoreductase [Chloroflexota bacterium]